MSTPKTKPPPFNKDSGGLSVGALNYILENVLRGIEGGPGIKVVKSGDRITIQAVRPPAAALFPLCLVTVVEEFGGYLECDRDGATVLVAKPWGLREDADWPTGPDYTYTSYSTRTADDGETTETQLVTPGYEVGEELLVARVPSARITGDADEQIVWIDLNVAGRCWATTED